MAQEYFKQKCWHCRYATNRNLCPWVRKRKLPKGAQQDDNGFIVECPLYEWDEITETRTTQQIAEDLGLTYNNYIVKRKQARAYATLLHLLKLHNYEELAQMLDVDAKTVAKWKRNKKVTSSRYITKLNNLRKEMLKDYE